jgi:hypothetical protein
MRTDAVCEIEPPFNWLAQTKSHRQHNRRHKLCGDWAYHNGFSRCSKGCLFAATQHARLADSPHFKARDDHECEQRVPARKLRRDIGQSSNARPSSSTISCPVDTVSSDRAGRLDRLIGRRKSFAETFDTSVQFSQFSDDPYT